MANESFLHLNAHGFISSSAGQPAAEIAVGLGSGLAFQPRSTTSIMLAARVPESVLLATGLTFSLLMSGDPLNADPGKSVMFGVTVGPIRSGTSKFDESTLAGCLETTNTVALPMAVGVLSMLPFAVPVTSMGSLAAGGWCLIRIRRLGLNPGDTHLGRVVVLGVDVRNT